MVWHYDAFVAMHEYSKKTAPHFHVMGGGGMLRWPTILLQIVTYEDLQSDLVGTLRSLFLALDKEAGNDVSMPRDIKTTEFTIKHTGSECMFVLCS
jgi:hypothetical protein